MLNALIAGSLASCSGTPTSQEDVDQKPAEQRLSAQELASLRCLQGAHGVLKTRDAFAMMSNLSLSRGYMAGLLAADISHCETTGELPVEPKVAEFPESWLEGQYLGYFQGEARPIK